MVQMRIQDPAPEAPPVEIPPTEPGTFGNLFETQRVRLFRALCLVTGNRHEAEEIAQNAFAAVWERWDRVGRMDDPVGYLFRTAMNDVRSRRRRAGLALRRQPRLRSVADPLSQVEERQTLAGRLAQLSHKQRASVVLLDALELTSDEAGAVLGMSPGAVRTQASRARAALRRMAGEDDA